MALERRELVGFDPRWAAINAGGGLFVATRDTDWGALREQVVRGRIRALEVHTADLDPLEGLPLEYLFVVGRSVDGALLTTLANLRGLSLDTLAGHFSLNRLPHLRWFGIAESVSDQLEHLVSGGHGRLEWLSVGKYREPDLRPVAELPQLAHLSIVESRSLVSLAGLGALSRLRVLELAICPKLKGIDGIDSARALQGLVLDSCNQVESLDPLAAVEPLRVIQLEMRSPPPLSPLVGHPSLEFLWLVGGKRPEGEVEMLLDNARLRMVNMKRASWMRRHGRWARYDNVYAMTPGELRLYEDLVDELNGVKYG